MENIDSSPRNAERKHRKYTRRNRVEIQWGSREDFDRCRFVGINEEWRYRKLHDRSYYARGSELVNIPGDRTKFRDPPRLWGKARNMADEARSGPMVNWV